MALRSDRLDAIVSLSKRRGFVYPSSEIYGGLRAAWDYGPLGVELKNNIKRQWWRAMVTERDDIVGLDSSVILAREVWEASGHVTEFVDPLTECMSCHKRYRADHLIEAYEEKHGHAPAEGLKEIACPNCGTRGAFTEPRMFNGLLSTHLGAVEDDSGLAYLRPETAQGIFINFRNVLQTSRKKIPFGIGQIGKSFRNEITPGNFIFRTREFEQMEMEFFVKPGTDEEWHQRWIDERFAWYADLGIRKENLRLYEHPREKLSHYSKRTVDIEYRFDFTGSEWGELEGIANRTDFDLKTHQNASKQDMSFLDQESGERFIPFVIEPAAGVDRGALTFLLDAYGEDEAPDAKGKLEKRAVLRLDRRLAPVKVAVLPLSRNADLSPKARDLAAALRKRWNCDFDDASAIGRRYRRQDEIGTPYLRHRRFRHPGGPGGHGPRPRHHAAGAGRHRRPGGLPMRAPRPLLITPVDLGRGLVEALGQPGRGHGRGDLLHLGHPAPALGRRRPGRGVPPLLQAGLGETPLLQQNGLHPLGPGQRPGRQQQRGRPLGPGRVRHLHRGRRARRRHHPRVHVGAAEQRLYLGGARPGQVQPGEPRRRRGRPDDPAVRVAGPARLDDRRDLPRRRRRDRVGVQVEAARSRPPAGPRPEPRAAGRPRQ